MNKRRPRVFLIEKSERFDTKPAVVFGDRVFLNPSASVFKTDVWVQEVRTLLDKHCFNCLEDFIAVSGPTQALAVFVGTVMADYAPHNTYQHKVVGIEYDEDEEAIESEEGTNEPAIAADK